MNLVQVKYFVTSYNEHFLFLIVVVVIFNFVCMHLALHRTHSLEFPYTKCVYKMQWNAKRTEIHLTSNRIVWYRTETSEETVSHLKETDQNVCNIVVHYYYARYSVRNYHRTLN